MLRKCVTGVICAAVVLVAQSGAFAQTTASQGFNVIVPSKLSISAPPAISINHDETDANQVFPPQNYVAQCNGANGATVSFATTGPFRATVGATTYRRDAGVALALGSGDPGAGWAVTVGSATATTAAPVATVTAASSAPGGASLVLTLTFVDGDFSALPAATFSTTVNATITAN